MRWLVRALDAQGDWLCERFPPKNQVRLGVVMVDLGLVLCGAVFLTNEPPLIFEMSAMAILFSGITTVVAAVLAQHEEDRP